jgi:acyl carrier protein
MNDNNVEIRVVKLIADHVKVDPLKVKKDSSFSSDLGFDSLDLVELVMAFEEEFNIEIPDEAAEKIVKVSDAINYIEEKIKKAV